MTRDSALSTTLAGIVLDPLANPSVPQLCPAVLQAQDCFDTGQDTAVRADASSSNVVLWRLESFPGGDAGPVGPRLLALWPAACGQPAYVTHRDRFEMTWAPTGAPPRAT